MFKSNPAMHPNPYIQEAYEADPNLQIIYNSVEEVTAKFPHIERLYDVHRAGVKNGSEVNFYLERVGIAVQQFSFIGFVLAPQSQ